MWLLENREILEEGLWPPEHIETGYTGMGRAVGHSATFEIPVMCIAELNARIDVMAELHIRLDAAKTDGKLLIAEVQAGKTPQELSYEALTILKYLSGWKRKSMSLVAWRKQFRYRQKRTTESSHSISLKTQF